MMGAMVLFSLFANNANDSMVRGSRLLTQIEVEYTAIALAQTIVDEARTKSFDRVTVAVNPSDRMIVGNSSLPGAVNYPNGFTAPANLGVDVGEVYPVFNDFDDYHNLSLIRATEYGNYTITATVTYVRAEAVETAVSARTNLKRLRVTVNHPNLLNPITTTYVKTYY